MVLCSYLSTSQVAAFTKVDESVSAVTAWLEGFPHEVNSITGTIKCSLAVKHAANLFSTTFSELRHDVTGQTAIIGAAVNVPVDVAVHIEAVFGVHGLPLPPRQNIPAPETSGVTPSVITSVYNVSGITPRGSTDNVQAVAEFQGQLISQADLTTFFSKFVPNAKSGDDKVYKYVGDNAQGQGVEANLDIQYIMGVAPGIKCVPHVSNRVASHRVVSCPRCLLALTVLLVVWVSLFFLFLCFCAGLRLGSTLALASART